ncbi:efflux RND transporter periplasmic adaptor subunit [Microvirga rosea]|uniref:efflux RND transporter periplasmic adaptor subunit n=1 Tax=Microvirga rosea TaxID=2715425 RepID=UPI001D0B4EB8|nr:efflux RND transporter periplasmic adaptor subunit [Microvirga rosea]MCB8820582.1 efflux RND transporter periplasmic adaptor subunit [Microvirga rosea]
MKPVAVIGLILFSAWCGPTLAQAPADEAEVRAQLTPRHMTILSSEIAGKVVSLPFREGDAFEAGQELAGLDCSALQARLSLAQAQLDRAERKLVALKQLDQRGATGKVDLDLAVIDTTAAKADLEVARIDVAHCRVPAPFSGRVSESKVQRYQYVTVGQPLLDILSDKELELELVAPSRWLAWLQAGEKLSVRVDELERTFPAIVTRIGARIDPVSQTVKIYARIDGVFPELRTGMSGLAQFSHTGLAAQQP